MGGADRLERQRRGGRMDARQRIDALLDAGSFCEIGTLVGGAPAGTWPAVAADAFVCGSGRIDGRIVLVGAEDFTSRGGSIGLGTHAKRYRLVELAEQERIPLVFILEGAGERVTNALERLSRSPHDLQALARLSGLVPSVCLVLGASAGHGALAAPLMDYAVMCEDAAIFAAGPTLVADATGEQIGKMELGGPAVQVDASGVVHDVVADEAEALARARRYLSYFGASAWEHPPRSEDAEGPRRLDDLLEVLPADDRRPYDMAKILSRVFDTESVLELQTRYGASITTALARLGGESVAVLASQPKVRAGAIDREAADKAARFLEVANAFHLPVVFMADTPGVMAGLAAERSGALRAGARLFHTQCRLQTPKLHVTLRKAFGFGSSIMAMNPFDRQTRSLALPGTSLGAMPAGGGGAAASVDAGLQQQLDVQQADGPWAAADGLAYDEVIDPRELRNALLAALATSERRREQPAEPLSGGIRP
ncbi:MAG: acetyl-CoA carboxylase carboxyltransferase subunit [Deltaproteobacteria bacterium]|nr:acetyl-CoA carboxylase carboxyltransferase subunit [Deltaproteobacteria bacterium]MBW2361685.1 acetyl-CoA carboxylase carboxyltransferase subunit [Deltaproteobacteria bacterium]